MLQVGDATWADFSLHQEETASGPCGAPHPAFSMKLAAGTEKVHAQWMNKQQHRSQQIQLLKYFHIVFFRLRLHYGWSGYLFLYPECLAQDLAQGGVNEGGCLTKHTEAGVFSWCLKYTEASEK